MTLPSHVHTFAPTTVAPLAAAPARTHFIRALRCKECGTEVPVTTPGLSSGTAPIASPTSCEEDFAPLEIAYDYEAMRGVVTRASIEAGPRSIWRYRALLPITGEPKAGLRSGWTPLVKADNLARALGVDTVYVKDDSVNIPTFSYKDRVVAVALTRAIELGYTTIGCASTGNLAHSVAAHAATAGLESFVVVPHDLEVGKIVATRAYGANLVKVRGNYDDVNRLCTEIADRYGWALVNVNLRPFYTEGAKTVGFEIAEQLGWELPKHTILPVAGGTILPKVWKAYQEFITLGLVSDNQPKIYGAQAAGCDPIATAIREGTEMFRPQKPNTIAKSIAIGNPADGFYALDVIRRSGGSADSASDAEIISAIKLLARTEGIFTEPAGGTTLAVTKRLIDQGVIPRDEPICICITGNGLKTVEALDGQFDDAPPIEARIEAFAGAVERARVNQALVQGGASVARA